MTLNGHFTLYFHYYEQPLRNYFYVLTVQSVYTRDQLRYAEADRTVIRRIIGIRRKKLRIFRRHYIVGTLTNKANISI